MSCSVGEAGGDVATPLRVARVIALLEQQASSEALAEQRWREGYELGLARGIERGRAEFELELLAEVDAEKRAQVGLVAALTDAAPPPMRWHVCCLPCRRAGHRPGCRDCRDGTRADFGRPMPGEYAGEPVDQAGIPWLRRGWYVPALPIRGAA